MSSREPLRGGPGSFRPPFFLRLMNTDTTASFALVIFASATAFAGDLVSKKAITPPEEERWKFSLSMPGWLPSMVGDTGVNGLVSHVDLDPFDIFRRYDMVASLRAEAEKGRFGVTSDWLYTSISDGVGTDTIVKKLDLQVDQTIGELALRWRLIDSPRGYFDVTAGVRYTNLFQKVVVQPDAELIGDASTALVDRVSEALRTALSASQLGELVAANVTAQLSRPDNRTPSPTPIGPLDGRLGERLNARLQPIIQAKQAELEAAVKAEAVAVGTAARAAAQRRVAGIKKDLSQRIAREVESGLDARVARTDDWWDPVIGMRARYNLNDRFYLTTKGDIGGFGVGSEFTWQAEGALGCNVTGNIFAEIGYRAFGVDYDQDGLVYDVIMHGAQVTMGIEF